MRNGSSAASIPNATPLLFLLTAAAVLLWPDALGITALVIVSAMVLPLAAYGFASSPGLAITALVAASAIPRLFVEIGGLKARPEHIVAGVLCISLLLLWSKRRESIKWIWPDYLIAGYCALNLFSSAFMSIAPTQTVKWAMQQLLAISPYLILRFLITDRERFRWAFRVLLVVGSAASVYAMICFYSNMFFGTEFGVDLSQYGTMPATYGLQFEGNILGSYSGALLIMMLVMYLYEKRRRFLVGYSVALASMAISLSRGALGATLVAGLLVMIFALKRKLLTGKATMAVAKATLCALLVVLPAVSQHYSERFSTVDISDPTADPNTMTRVVQATTAFDEVLSHPFFGGGTASFQLAWDWQSLGIEWEDQGWIGNTELRVLHDTGLVGLFVFGGFVISMVRWSRKVLKNETNPELVALLAAAVVYCISFQATEGTLLSFFWVHMGLIGCAIALSSASDKVYRKGIAQQASV